MAKDTREKILAAALDMFSQYGFAGTNIRELAGSLGMGKSSMYRHFESKEDIWNTLLDGMIAHYEERFGSPISALIHLCDRGPEKTEAAIAQAEAFIRRFIRVYVLSPGAVRRTDANNHTAERGEKDEDPDPRPGRGV